MKLKTIFLMACALFAAGALSAQVDTMPEMYLNFAVAQFLSLYPEAAYTYNPANILQLKRPAFFTDLYISGSNNVTEYTHPEGWAGPGAAGGTWTMKYGYNIDELNLDAFFPLTPNMTLGIGANGTLDFDWDTEQEINYSADPQDFSSEHKGNSQDYGGTGYFAFRLGNLELGARAGLLGSRDPYSVTYETDAALNGGERYIASFFDDTHVVEFTPVFTAGAIWRKETFSVGLAADAQYSMTTTTPYIAVDQDANGFDETIVTMEDYYTTSEAWGAIGGPYPEYNREDSETNLTLMLYPSFIYKLKPSLSLFLTGGVSALDSRSVTQYEHLTAADLSQNRMDYRYTTIAGTAGIAWKPGAKLELRAGLGYQGSGSSQTNNDLDAAGASVFDPLNTGHYAEAALGAQPDNDAVMGAVNTTNDTYKEFMHGVLGLLALEYAPAPSVLLFSGAGLAFSNSVETYTVFNTTDNTVWEEKNTDNGITAMYQILLGVGMFVTDKLFLGLQTQGGMANFGFDKDGLPTSGGSASTGAGTDLTTKDTSNYFNISIFCVLGL